MRSISGKDGEACLHRLRSSYGLWPPDFIAESAAFPGECINACWFFTTFFKKLAQMLHSVPAVWISRTRLEPRGRSKNSLKSCESCCRCARRAGSEDRDHGVTNDYDDFDISCRQLCFFHFLANCLSSGPVLVGFPLGLVWAPRFLLNLTFVSTKMVDMQNVEQCAAHAWVLLAVWEMRYEECLLGYNR